MVTSSTSGATSAKVGIQNGRGGEPRSKSMSQFRGGPSRCWGLFGMLWDKERGKGDRAHFHRPCSSDKRNLACSSISRSLGFGSSDCSIGQLSCLSPFYASIICHVHNRSLVYIPFDSSPSGDDSCLE